MKFFYVCAVCSVMIFAMCSCSSNDDVIVDSFDGAIKEIAIEMKGYSVKMRNDTIDIIDPGGGHGGGDGIGISIPNRTPDNNLLYGEWHEIDDYDGDGYYKYLRFYRDNTSDCRNFSVVGPVICLIGCGRLITFLFIMVMMRDCLF